ncbi:MAG: ATP-dependent helicase, partial [Psychrosphaera sp.]|nr:ATP-dependent helicase [Psychrosphaera sp.]
YSRHKIINSNDDSEIFLKEAVENCGLTTLFNSQAFKLKPALLHELLSYRRNVKKKLTYVIKTKYPKFEPLTNKIKRVNIEYRKILQRHNRMQFEDIINRVARKISKSPKSLHWLTDRIGTILIDEAQDTNPLQWQLIKPIAKHIPVMVVGDDAQLIYGFRGAKPANIRRIRSVLPKATQATLSLNYRSTTDILNLSNDLMRQSKTVKPPALISNSGIGTKPLLASFLSEKAEAQFIVDSILRHLENGGGLQDIMILARLNADVELIAAALQKADIPYVTATPAKFYNSNHIKDLTAILRIVMGSSDVLSIQRYLGLFPGIGLQTANKLVDEYRIFDTKTSIKVIKRMANSAKIQASLLRAYKIIIHLRAKDGVSQVIASAVQQLDDIFAAKFANQTLKWCDRQGDVRAFVALAKPYDDISEFLNELSLNADLTPTHAGDVVQVMTVHSAKGMEAKICYLINASPGIYPYYRANTQTAIDEELNILYVAMTRAQKKLVITNRACTKSKKHFKSQFHRDRFFLNKINKKLLACGLQP